MVAFEGCLYLLCGIDEAISYRLSLCLCPAFDLLLVHPSSQRQQTQHGFNAVPCQRSITREPISSQLVHAVHNPNNTLSNQSRILAPKELLFPGWHETSGPVDKHRINHQRRNRLIWYLYISYSISYCSSICAQALQTHNRNEGPRKTHTRWLSLSFHRYVHWQSDCTPHCNTSNPCSLYTQFSPPHSLLSALSRYRTHSLPYRAAARPATPATTAPMTATPTVCLGAAAWLVPELAAAPDEAVAEFWRAMPW